MKTLEHVQAYNFSGYMNASERIKHFVTIFEFPDIL